MTQYVYNKLKGRIVEHYGTIDEMAKRMGISRVSLYNKMSSKIPFKQWEIGRMCDLLNIKPDEIGTYFFQEKL